MDLCTWLSNGNWDEKQQMPHSLLKSSHTCIETAVGPDRNAHPIVGLVARWVHVIQLLCDEKVHMDAPNYAA